MKKIISIDRVTVLAIAIPMVALLFVGSLTTKYILENAFAERTDSIIQKVERLASTVSDAETGQRGFIITGKASYFRFNVDNRIKLGVACTPILFARLSFCSTIFE